MTNIDIYPMQDNYETTLARSRDWAIWAVYVNTVPWITFPSWKTTYITVNPWKSNQQVAIINAIDTSLKTVTVSSISVDKSPWVAYSQQTHAVWSIVRISNNYEARQNVVDAVDSKLDSIWWEAASFDLTITWSNWRVRKDWSDMKLTDDNQSEITLSTLASWWWADEKVKISVNDTTAWYLNWKLTWWDGITLTETNDWGNETLDIDVDITDTTKFVTTKTASKVPVLDWSWEIDTFLSSAIPLVASDAEFITWTNSTKFVVPSQASFTIVSWDTLLASADATQSTLIWTYAIKKDIEVDYAWTYKVSFTISAWSSTTTQWRIYVDWVAVWTERSVSSSSSSSFDEDITVTAWQSIQLYIKATWSFNGATCSNFRIYYGIKPILVDSTVIMN